MPLTPFHLGPALLLGSLLHRRIDLPTLLVASVVIDVRAALVLFGPLDGPTHGILTTFVGAAAVALLVAGVAYGLPAALRSPADHVRLGDTDRGPAILAAAVVGTYSQSCWTRRCTRTSSRSTPKPGNPPALGIGAVTLLYGGCPLAGVVALPVVASRWLTRHRA